MGITEADIIKAIQPYVKSVGKEYADILVAMLEGATPAVLVKNSPPYIASEQITGASYEATISYKQTFRPSLTGNGGVDDIVKLFNTGYACRHAVSGYWHGKLITSRINRQGRYFIESTVKSFNAAAAFDGVNAHASYNG